MACMCGDSHCFWCGPAQGNHKCFVCGKWDDDGGCDNPGRCRAEEESRSREAKVEEKANLPDWSKQCTNCEAKPVVPATGLCGPCTFGEAETAGGNW